MRTCLLYIQYLVVYLHIINAIEDMTVHELMKKLNESGYADWTYAVINQLHEPYEVYYVNKEGKVEKLDWRKVYINEEGI